MKKNVGKTDMIVRVVIAIVIIVLGIVYKSWWGLLAVLPLIGVVTGNCLLYNLLGVNTGKKK